jgi:hypothetical protein
MAGAALKAESPATRPRLAKVCLKLYMSSGRTFARFTIFHRLILPRTEYRCPKTSEGKSRPELAGTRDSAKAHWPLSAFVEAGALAAMSRYALPGGIPGRSRL